LLEAGSVLQFTQNEDNKEELLKTAGTTLVYADPYDTLLGIGLSMCSPDISKRGRWQGRNLLGQVLTEIRDEMLSHWQVVVATCALYVALWLKRIFKEMYNAKNVQRFMQMCSKCLFWSGHLSYNRQHYEIDDCLEDSREDYYNYHYC